MIFRREVTASTNADARAGAPGDVFVAEFQTAGRGRLDHEWQSAKGENLTFSAVLDVGDRPPADVATLPLVVGIAVAKALSGFVPGEAEISLKWPNDVLCGMRKICGILCERIAVGVIAGVGINVNQVRFRDDIAERATSLALVAGAPIDREAVLGRVIDSIFSCHRRWLGGGFEPFYGEYAGLDCLKGRWVSVSSTDGDGAPATGICGGVCQDGSLLVGGRRIWAGEAHVGSF